MAQKYTEPHAIIRMAHGKCPECGERPDRHLSDDRFWMPRRCSLTPQGVTDRIEQHARDSREVDSNNPG